MRSTRTVVLTVTCFLLAAAAWAGWFGWDTARDVDPGTGSSTGPYEIWQGIGAAITLLAVIVLFVRWLPTVNVVLGVSVGFTAGFTSSGATDPEADGLYVVGAGILLLVMLLATTLAAWGARKAVGRRERRSDPQHPPAPTRRR
jgi:hypothetical protein